MVICCNYSKDGHLIVSGTLDKVCKLWDARMGEEILSFTVSLVRLPRALPCDTNQGRICQDPELFSPPEGQGWSTVPRRGGNRQQLVGN